MKTSNELENGHSLVDPGRRDFLSTIALAGAASFLPFVFHACSKTEQFTGTGKVPFKVWEEMLHSIKTSADYLPLRMEQLIESKDLKAMFHFVKDELVLMPPRTKNLNGLGTDFKYGLKAVLRSGWATPREKVELLNAMYQKAGVDSKVVFERTDIKPEEVPAFFYRPLSRHFNPAISKRQFKSWKNEIGFSNDAATQNDLIKDYSNEATALGNSLLNHIGPYDKYAMEFDFRWDNYRTPTLEFVVDGTTKYAHLFDPNIPFELLKNDNGGKTSPADPIVENDEQIIINLSYRNSIDPKHELNLLSGQWKAAELVGKQIKLNFLHGLSLEEQVVTSIGNLRIFTPSLSLQAIDESVTYMSDRSFLGDPITIDGKRIKISSEKNTSIDGNTLIKKAEPDLQKKVAELNVKASASGYPVVKVQVTAQDISGKLIEGLSAKDFKFTEDGKSLSVMMESNQQTPKILVLSDASFSMPKEYYAEGMAAFNTKLEQNILDKYPSAVVDYWKTPSSLFTWLLKASQTNYDLIIYATDGDNDDSYDEENFSIYQAGPPALILNVRNTTWHTRVETFNKMATVTKGMAMDAKDQSKVLNEISKKIDALAIPPYHFSYASADRNKAHTIEVRIDNDRLKTSDQYKFPELSDYCSNGIIGFYLEMKVGQNKPIKRVLAGWDDKNELFKPKSDYAKRVQSLLLGGVLLAVEGEGPTLSVALCDLLKSKLSNRSWGEAYLDDDINSAKEALAKGIIEIPSILISMMSPLQDQVTHESMTFASGYRMCLQKTMVGVARPTNVSFDYLPTSNYVTMAKDKRDSFAINIQKTSQLAIREATLFQQSTYILLENSELVSRETANKEKWLKNQLGYKHKDARYWREAVFRGNGYYKVFDRNAVSKAFWKIHRSTGEMYGIMPDGSGGGFNRFEEQLEELEAVIEMYSKIFDAMGVANPAIAIVAIYGKTLVKLYAIVSEVIIVMDASGMDDAITEALMEMACEVAKEIITSLTGKAGEIMGGLDTIIGLMVGDENNPLSC